MQLILGNDEWIIKDDNVTQMGAGNEMSGLSAAVHESPLKSRGA